MDYADTYTTLLALDGPTSMKYRPLSALLLGMTLLQRSVILAHACSCGAATPGPPMIEAAKADLVFVGTVLLSSPINPGTDLDCAHRSASTSSVSAGPSSSCIRVEADIKGALLPLEDVRIDSAVCGFHFMVGRSYVIYAVSRDGQYWAEGCTRTSPIVFAQEDLAAFGLTYPILHRVFLPQVFSPNLPRSAAALQLAPAEALRTSARYGPACSSRAQTAYPRHREILAR